MPEGSTTTATTTDAGNGNGGTDDKAPKGGTAGQGAAPGAGSTTAAGQGAATDTGDDLIARLRAENRDAKREAAALREKAKKFDEYEEASKSEQQKANDRAAAAEAKAAEQEKRVWRYEVAAAKGVPAKLAGRLQGDTKEEMEADADDLLATLTASGAGGQQRRTAGNAADEGGAPAGTMNDWIRGRAGKA